MWEKFHVDDIRKLKLLHVDEESEDEAELTPNTRTRVEQKKMDKLYDVISVVGAGGVGVVIACLDRSSNKKFALKIAS